MVETKKIVTEPGFMVAGNNTANNSENKEKHQEIEACQCNGIHLPYTDRMVFSWWKNWAKRIITEKKARKATNKICFLSFCI